MEVSKLHTCPWLSDQHRGVTQEPSTVAKTDGKQGGFLELCVRGLSKWVMLMGYPRRSPGGTVVQNWDRDRQEASRG